MVSWGGGGDFTVYVVVYLGYVYVCVWRVAVYCTWVPSRVDGLMMDGWKYKDGVILCLAGWVS